MEDLQRDRVDQVLDRYKGKALTPQLMEEMRMEILDLSRQFYAEGATITDENGEQISSFIDLVVLVQPNGPGRIKISARHKRRSYE